MRRLVVSTLRIVDALECDDHDFTDWLGFFL
jgi:hypothetical protein